jgi:hypothetical protein
MSVARVQMSVIGKIFPNLLGTFGNLKIMTALRAALCRSVIIPTIAKCSWQLREVFLCCGCQCCVNMRPTSKCTSCPACDSLRRGYFLADHGGSGELV